MALRLGRALLDLLFPPRCVVCGAAGADLCGVCLGKIRRPPEPRCARCDTPLADGRGAHGGLCGKCVAGIFAPDVDRVVVAAVYEGTVRSAIHALKYNGKRRAAEPLAGLALAAWRASGLGADVIVPVPLHRSRSRPRGYNQTDLLALSLAREAGLPVRRDALARTRATAAQAHLPASERWPNVAGAFAPLPGAAALSGRTILLMDDVVTTGATIQAAASALREARPAAIYALAVARPSFVPENGPSSRP